MSPGGSRVLGVTWGAPADPEAGQPLRLQEQRLNTYAESSFINADLTLSPQIVPQPLRA